MRKYSLLALVTVLCTHIVSADTIEEIVVFAQKREQKLTDIGISITALTGEQMERLGFENAQQIANMAPSVSTIQPNGEANYAIGIRGVANSDFTTNVESPVAIYLDEVYISQMSNAGFMLYDMERVEILRGPQGTLYGRNATGGLLHFITRKPTQDRNRFVKLTYGDYDKVDTEAALNLPLSETLSTRFSFSDHNADGYVTNRLGGKLNNTNDFSARWQLLYEPSSTSSLLLNARTANQDINTGFYENVSSVIPGELTPTTPNPVLDGYVDTDGDVFAGDYDRTGFNDMKTRGYTATYKTELGSVNLTSISDYSTVERRYIEDSDSSPVPLFAFFLTTDAKQVSQEVRLDAAYDRLSWVAGLYYLDLQVSDSNGGITESFMGGVYTDLNLPRTAGSEAGLTNPYTSDLTSISAFGQVEVDLSDSVSMSVGGRYIEDKKDFDYRIITMEFLNSASQLFDKPSNHAQPVELLKYAGGRRDGEWAGKLGLNWARTVDQLLYASVNRGVKGGGYNAPIFPFATLEYSEDTMSFDPEHLVSWEAGFKQGLLDNRLRINGATYYYDYQDYQSFSIIGFDTLTFNSDAVSKGFELEMQATPVNGLDVLLGYAWNDIEVDLGNGIKTPSIQSPKHNMNGMVRYEWSLAGGIASVQADATYRSEHFFALGVGETVRENGYTVWNTAIRYADLDDTWSITGFIDNAGDEKYLAQAFDFSGLSFFGMTERYYGRPRWWGVSMRYNWNQ